MEGLVNHSPFTHRSVFELVAKDGESMLRDDADGAMESKEEPDPMALWTAMSSTRRDEVTCA